MKSPTAHPLLRIVQDLVGQARLERMTLQLQYEFTSDLPLGRWFIGHMRGGRALFRTGPEEVRVPPGDVFVLNQPDACLGGAVADAVIDFAVLEPGLLHEVAQNASTEPGPVRILASHPVSGVVGGRWARTLAVARDLVTSPLALKSDLFTAQVSRLVAAATLETFPNTAMGDTGIADRRDAHPATLRRAVAFIEANPQNDVSVADIDRATRTSVRMVQLAFRRYLNTTLMRYLQQVRLHQASDELRVASPGGPVTVTSVAARWGFSTPARFSLLYRQEFGLTPVQTLRGEHPPLPVR